ncbi:MAG: hypothetical protein WAV20_19455 [Blastocatellia bacterium]
MFKLGTLWGQVRISNKPDGTISTDLINEYGQPKILREVSPMKYCDGKWEDCIAFRRDDAGKVQAVVDFPHVVFQRVPWYETRPLNLAVIIPSVVVFGVTLALWPVAAVTRRHFGRRLELSASRRWRRRLVILVCAINLTCILAGHALFRRLPDPSLEVWVHVFQGLLIVGAFGTLAVLYDAVRCWRDPGRWWFSKLHAIAAALACLGVVWFALIWNLFEFSSRY